jgi:hypothetical protein
MALEFLIQRLERLGFGFQGIPFGREHSGGSIIRGVHVATTSLIRRGEAPELCHQGDRLGREPSKRRLGGGESGAEVPVPVIYIGVPSFSMQ